LSDDTVPQGGGVKQLMQQVELGGCYVHGTSYRPCGLETLGRIHKIFRLRPPGRLQKIPEPTAMLRGLIVKLNAVCAV
jgi:hypothetical protein